METNDRNRESAEVECSPVQPKESLREQVVTFPNCSSVTVNMLNCLVNEAFDVGKKIRLYNFFGLEIMDDSDLCHFRDYLEKHGVIFFTRVNEFFENKNLMRSLAIKNKLGEGGFAKVYLAEQKFRVGVFAIKYFRFDLTIVRDVNFLYKEIDALRRLENKNIIKLYTYCILDNEKIALILEYASGGTLKDYVKEKKRMEEPECRIIFKQILDTVNYCHRKGIIHRDLKLENIVFADKRNKLIKIIDFGLSGLFKSDKSTAGSIRYMAPEVLDESNTESNPQLDIWSLGCILYELLTGDFLFPGDRDAVKSNVLGGRYYLPDSLLPEAAHLITSMVRTHPSERIDIEDCLFHPWVRSLPLGEMETNELNSPNSLNSRLNVTKTTDLAYLDPSPRSPLVKDTLTFPKQKLLPNSKRPLRCTSPKMKKKERNELPSLITKITKDFNESSMYDYHYTLMKSFGGNIPNFLQPIGHNKEQKQKIFKIKNFMMKYHEILNPESTMTTLKEVKIKKSNTFSGKSVLSSRSNIQYQNTAFSYVNSFHNTRNSVTNTNPNMPKKNINLQNEMSKKSKIIFDKIESNAALFRQSITGKKAFDMNILGRDKERSIPITRRHIEQPEQIKLNKMDNIFPGITSQIIYNKYVPGIGRTNTNLYTDEKSGAFLTDSPPNNKR